MLTKEEIQDWLKELQDHICGQLEQADGGATFIEDTWQREGGGGGRSRVIADGAALAKGGVNFSAVHGNTPEKILKALNLPPADFFATGISIVLHPVNPWVPIIHMNLRYFEMSEGTSWFGGGIDVTPHYIIAEDARYVHTSLKAVCDKHDPDYYPRFKQWADDYFYLPHRKETRGIGGIFFDRLGNDSKDKSAYFPFIQDTGNLFAPLYLELIRRNRDKNYGDQEIEWQRIRRGRYAEFNLAYDKGTKFGLETNGRTESILMSLPPMAEWRYNFQVAPNSPEATTLNLLKKDIHWI